MSLCKVLSVSRGMIIRNNIKCNSSYKRMQSNNSLTKHRTGGFNSEWLSRYDWLLNVSKGMICTVCRKHVSSPKFSIEFVTQPSTNYRQDAIESHRNSQMHMDAMTRELGLRTGRTLPRAMAVAADLEHWALEGCFRILYKNVKHKQPHHTMYGPDMKLCKALGCNYFEALNVNEKTNYTSAQIINEMLEITGDMLLSQLVDEVKASPAWGIMVDETMDISITKQLGVNIRYLKEINGRMAITSKVLGVVSLTLGDAATVTDAILELLRKTGMPLDSMSSFASDGASVMTGRKNGVGQRLKQVSPELITVHCVAHRLNLAVSDVCRENKANAVRYLGQYTRTLKSLFWFYESSCNRSESLRAMQSVFELPQLKLQGGNETRWERCREAVDVLYRVLPAVLADLSSQAEHEPVAKGLLHFCRNKHFPATVILMKIAHEKLGRVFKVFQKRELFFGQVAKEIPALIASLRQLLVRPVVRDMLADWLEDPKGLRPFQDESPQYFKPDTWTSFEKSVMEPFISKLTANLEKRFPDLGRLESFAIFNPCEAQQQDHPDYGCLQMTQLATEFSRHIREADLLNEWDMFRPRMMDRHFEATDLEDCLHFLVRRDVAELYPQLSKLAAIALTVPMQTADVERLFSALKLVRTPLRNRLQGKYLDICLRIAIDGPDIDDLKYGELVRRFYQANPNRRIKCSRPECDICGTSKTKSM